MPNKFARQPLAIAAMVGLVGTCSLSQASDFAFDQDLTTALALADIGAAYDGELTFAAENLVDGDYLVDTSGTIATGAGRLITSGLYWCANFGLNAGDKLVLTFHNILFASDDARLLSAEAAIQQPLIGAGVDINADGDIGDVLEVASNFGVLDADNGVSEITFRINQNLTLPTNACLIIADSTANCVESSDDGVPDSNDCLPKMLIPMGATGEITVSSSVESSGDISIPAGDAVQTIANIANQLIVTLVNQATSTPNVNADPPLFSFADEGAGSASVFGDGDDTDLLLSGADFTLSNGLDTSGFGNDKIEDAIILGASDTLTITLNPTSGNLGAVDELGTSQFIFDGGITENFSVINAGSLTASVDGSDIDAAGSLTALTARNTVATTINAIAVIGVHGEELIESREWMLNLDLALGENSAAEVSSFVSHIWEHNGTVLTFPFMTITDTLTVNRFVMTNGSWSDARFIVEILAPSSTGQLSPIGITPGQELLGEVPARSSYAIHATDILAGLEKGTRAAVRITVLAPKRAISGAYQIKSPGGVQTVYVAGKE